MSESAPRRQRGQSAGRFLRGVTAYLTEPHRRRLGHETEREVLEAIQELERGQ